jgi:hypothetical protein
MTGCVNRHRPAAFAVGLSAFLLAPNAGAQTTDTASYPLFGQPIPLVVYLDSIAVYAPGVTAPDAIVAAGAPLGFVSARAVGQGIFAVALGAMRSRTELAILARDAAALPPIRVAGLAVRPPGGPDPVIVTDHFIVEFQPGVSGFLVDSLNAASGVEVVKRLALLGNDYLLRVTRAAGIDAMEMANRYHAHPLVSFATPDFIARNREQAWFPNDELFARQWHLHNSVNDADVDAPEAWDKTTGSPSIVIAALEVFGFDVANKDIQDNLSHAWSFKGCGSADDYGVTTPCGSATFVTDMKHGTAVAGLAAGRGDNGEGISGVCPRCGLMLIEMPVADAAIAQTLKHAADMGADVINNSWARDIANAYTAAALDDVALTGRGGLGTVVVWSVRDLDADRCTGTLVDLAQLPSGIAVGASNDLDQRGSPSGFGECLDLLAPGYATKTTGAVVTNLTGITTADQTGNQGYNNQNTDPTGCAFAEPTTGTKPLDYTRCFAGTSAAAPIVAGVAGLVLSMQPCLKRPQVQEILNATADEIDAAAAGYDAVTDHSKTHGYGRVNAAAAVTEAEGAACATPPVGVVPPPTQLGLEIGSRFGVTRMWGGVDRSVANIPGSGPLSEPVVYAAWAVTPTVALQFQLGGAVRTGGPNPTEKVFVAAAQPEAVFGAVYGGANIAMRVLAVGGGPTTTDFGAGLAVGYRMLPLPFLALRLEGRYRRWFTTPAIDEIGLALAVGVVIN